MKLFLPIFGALVISAAAVGGTMWLWSDDAPPPSAPLKDFELRYADGSRLWHSGAGEPSSPLVRQVLADLGRQASLQETDLRKVGAIVVTTIDPKAQAAGAAVVATAVQQQPETLRYSITAIDPATGGVKVYVPGESAQDETDHAGGVLKEPGRTFMPINVVAALQQGKTMSTTYDGSSPRKIAGVQIRSGSQCGEPCTLRTALIKSSNTAMYDLVVNEIGIRPVVAAARQAGVPEDVIIGDEVRKQLVGEGGGIPNGSVSLGGDGARMRPLDLTAAYATFAADGAHHPTHFVTKVTDDSGVLLYQAVEQGTSAFHADGARGKEIATEVNSALREGTLCPGAVCRGGEWELPGTTGRYSHAWTTGFTSKLAVTVYVGGADGTKPALDKAGAPIDGTGLPKDLWQKFVSQS